MYQYCDDLCNDPRMTPELMSALRRQMHRAALIQEDRFDTLLAKFESIRNDYRKSKRLLATDEQWETYRRLHTARIQRMARLRAQVGKTPKAAKELRAFRTQSIEEAEQRLVREGIDVAVLLRLFMETNEKMANLVREFYIASANQPKRSQDV